MAIDNQYGYYRDVQLDSDGNLLTRGAVGEYSQTAFKTTSLLASTATYTSSVIDVNGFLQVQTEILSSHNGTIVINFYSDSLGTDSVRSLTIPYIADDGFQFFSAPAFGDYIKYQFTNDGLVTQTDFYFTTKISTVSISPQMLRTDGFVSPKMVAGLSRSVNHFDLDAAREMIVGQRSFFFFGFNDAVGTGWEDIHPAGGDINWLTTPTKVEILSSNINDTSAGSGVQSVEIHGLSETGVDQDEVILTNGTSVVVSSLTYSRVNKMHSETCGTYGGSHQGDITCQVVGGGSVQSVMTGEEGNVNASVQYGSGEAGNGYWSVPLGKVMYITRLEVIPDVATNKTITIALYERDDLLTTSAPFSPRRVLWQESGVNSTVEHEFKSHIKIKSLADIWFRAKSDSGTSLIEVSLDFYLVDANADGK